jgi:gluconate 2-dehydrogenase gamma chain
MLEPSIRAALEAALDRVLPGGDAAGAREADAIRYAEWLITQRPYRHWHESVCHGVALLDTIAVSRHGAPFARCTAAERDAALGAVAAAPHPRAMRFMRVLVTLAIRGFLSDPKYGGNHDQIGWAFIGYAPLATPGEDEYAPQVSA